MWRWGWGIYFFGGGPDGDQGNFAWNLQRFCCNGTVSFLHSCLCLLSVLLCCLCVSVRVQCSPVYIPIARSVTWMTAQRAQWNQSGNLFVYATGIAIGAPDVRRTGHAKPPYWREWPSLCLCSRHPILKQFVQNNSGCLSSAGGSRDSVRDPGGTGYPGKGGIQGTGIQGKEGSRGTGDPGQGGIQGDGDPGQGGIQGDRGSRAGRDPGKGQRNRAGRDPGWGRGSRARRDPGWGRGSRAGRDLGKGRGNRAGWDPGWGRGSRAGRDPGGDRGSRAGRDPGGQGSRVEGDPKQEGVPAQKGEGIPGMDRRVGIWRRVKGRSRTGKWESIQKRIW